MVGGLCQKAQLGKFSELEGDCLLRIQCVLLRDIVGELFELNDTKEGKNDWEK